MKYLCLLLLLLKGIIGYAEEHFLSFAIPCFNCEDTIEETLASIYNQSLNIPFEVICTDDASTDNTLQILRACALKYPNFKIYQHEKNRGGGAARNTCTFYAQGDLIFNCDSDNVLVQDSIQGLVDLIDLTGADAASFEEARFFDCNSCRGNFRLVDRWNYSNKGYMIDFNNFIYAIFPAYQGNYLYTRKCFYLVEGYPEDCGAMDTFAFGVSLMCANCKMAILPNSFYWHRVNRGSKSYYHRDSDNSSRNLQKALRKVSEVFSDEFSEILMQDARLQDFLKIWPNIHTHLTSNAILEHLFQGYAYRKEGRHSEAVKEFSMAMQLGCHSMKIQKYVMSSLKKEK